MLGKKYKNLLNENEISKNMRLIYLDVLKAYAIIAVVLYHSGFMTYGYLGVDVFLVVAGYLTTRSLCGKLLVSNTLWGGVFRL